MKSIVLISLLCLIGCGKNNSNGFNGDGLTTASYTQENGFVDVQICGTDVHLVKGVAYVSGSSPLSQSSNSNYVEASGGYFEYPSYSLGKCWFYIDENGGFDTTQSAVEPNNF